MLKWCEGEWYGEMMPKGIKAKRDVGIVQVRWMVEKKIEENQGMMKEEAMKDGMKRGVFKDWNGLDEVLDFRRHMGKTFRQIHLEDPEHCRWAVNHKNPGAPWLSNLNVSSEGWET